MFIIPANLNSFFDRFSALLRCTYQPRISFSSKLFTPKSDQFKISPCSRVTRNIRHHTEYEELPLFYTTNSCYLTYTFLFKRLGECTFWIGQQQQQQQQKSALLFENTPNTDFLPSFSCFSLALLRTSPLMVFWNMYYLLWLYGGFLLIYLLVIHTKLQLDDFSSEDEV